MYDLELLSLILREDYGVPVQGADSDGIYIDDTGITPTDVIRYLTEISNIEREFADMDFRVYRAAEGLFIEVFFEY